MKKLVTLLMVLALPSVAFGAASLSLLSGGVNEITVDPGQIFNLEVRVWADTTFNTLGAKLVASSNGAFSVVSAGDDNFGANFPSSTSANFFNEDNFLPPDDGGYLTFPVLLGTADTYVSPMIPDVGFSRTGTTNISFSTARTVLSIPVTVVGGAGTTVILSNPNADFVRVQDGQPVGLDNVTKDVLTVHITPEPATMLLLAGALPFLRRRSA